MAQVLPTTSILTPAELKRIAAAWLARQQHQWSAVALRVMIDMDPDTAWRIVVRIVHEAADEPALINAGAGPLADMLNAYGNAFVDRVEELAAVSPAFRLALQYVWLSGDPSPVVRRLEALGCGRIAEHDEVELDS